MATTRASGGTTFIHYSNYSGDVRIIMPGGGELEVPFTDLRQLVFGYLRGKMVDAIEGAYEAEFEEMLPGSWGGGRQS